MPELNFTTLILFSFPEAMVLGFMSLSLLLIRPSFKQVLKIGCLQTIFDAFFFLIIAKIIYLPLGFHTILQGVVLSSIIWYIMGISFKKSFMATILGFTIYIAMESLMLPLVIFVTGHSMPIVNESNWLMRLPYHIMELVINLMMTFLIRHFKFCLIGEWFAERKINFLIVSGLLFVQTILITIMCLKYYSVNQEYLNSVGTIPLYFIVANAILPIITLIIIKQFMNFIRSDIENEAQLNIFTHVEEMMNNMRIQRHNFTHELQVIYGLLEVEEFQEARSYLKKSVDQVAITSEVVKTDNLGVTALLYTKIGLAEARKIDLEIQVEVSLQRFPLEARDINLILGNLIDNAMDAVEGMPIQERKVKIIIRQDLEGYVIEVKNYGPPISPDVINQIFVPQFSTKGEGRGMGLYSIQQLVHKYDGSIRVRSDNQDTCFQITIPAGQVVNHQLVKRNGFKGRWQIWQG